MKILDIKNRTENWKTAYYFAPFFRDKEACLRLAKELLARHEGKQANDVDLGPSGVQINLFWYGMRDHLNKDKSRDIRKDRVLTQGIIEDLAKRYKRLFIEELDLRKNIEEFITKRRKAREPKFRDLKPWNYRVSEPTKARKNGPAKLGSNLYETEIDVVLQTPNHLYIGEAKYESPLGAESKYVLVHQLIRQYVMAKILVDKLVSENRIAPKKVIPFFVRDNPTGQEQAQVDFMIQQCWMSENNVLTWVDIEKIGLPPLIVHALVDNVL